MFGDNTGVIRRRKLEDKPCNNHKKKDKQCSTKCGNKNKQ